MTARHLPPQLGNTAQMTARHLPPQRRFPAFRALNMARPYSSPGRRRCFPDIFHSVCDIWRLRWTTRGKTAYLFVSRERLARLMSLYAVDTSTNVGVYCGSKAGNAPQSGEMKQCRRKKNAEKPRCLNAAPPLLTP
jgi:hypothetical protein